jgi:ABC-type multidrug transport system ATPase subunit
MKILEVLHVSKSLGSRKVLKDISFGMGEGQLYGLVGENGSGKSTLLKIIVGQWKPSSGKIITHRRIGYCPQNLMLFPNLTVREHLEYFAAAYGISKQELKGRADNLLSHFNFKQYENEIVARLSGGTKQKLNLSLALLHDPELLILDEPYNGFDWRTYHHFWEYADHMRAQGCSILVVSHMLEDQGRFDQIFSLENGALS